MPSPALAVTHVQSCSASPCECSRTTGSHPLAVIRSELHLDRSGGSARVGRDAHATALHSCYSALRVSEARVPLVHHIRRRPLLVQVRSAALHTQAREIGRQHVPGSMKPEHSMAPSILVVASSCDILTANPAFHPQVRREPTRLTRD
jgi:hypothetical protein